MQFRKQILLTMQKLVVIYNIELGETLSREMNLCTLQYIYQHTEVSMYDFLFMYIDFSVDKSLSRHPSTFKPLEDCANVT